MTWIDITHCKNEEKVHIYQYVARLVGPGLPQGERLYRFQLSDGYSYIFNHDLSDNNKKDHEKYTLSKVPLIYDDSTIKNAVKTIDNYYLTGLVDMIDGQPTWNLYGSVGFYKGHHLNYNNLAWGSETYLKKSFLYCM